MKMKKMLCALLTLCMVLTMLPVGVLAAEEVIASGSSPAKWTLTADGTLTIDDTGEMESLSSYDRYPWNPYADDVTRIVIKGITSIGNEAFCSLENATELSLPDTLTHIGNHAFINCVSLETVTIPASVATMGYGVFQNCTNLKQAIFEDGSRLTELAVETFRKSGIETIDLPDTITAIGKNAFYNCENLVSIKLHEGLETIGEAAFRKCTSLASFTIPSTLKEIGQDAFTDCTSVAHLDLYGVYEGLVFSYEFYQSVDSLASVEAHAPMSYITGLEGCRKLKHVVLADTIEVIGESAFSDCSFLKEIQLPDNLKEVRGRAFYGTSLNVVNLPDTVTVVGTYAFGLNRQLKSFTVGAGLEVLPDYVCDHCSSMTTVDMGNVREIGYCAFSGCEKLTDLIWSQQLERIGGKAFEYCKALPSVTIPASVTQIEDWAFQYCNSLTEVIFEGDAPVIGTDVFRDVTATVYYPVNNDTWTADVMQNYGGTLTWEPYGECKSHTAETGEVTTPATCTANGIMTCVCDVCGETFTQVIPAIGHDYGTGAVTTEATCTEDGIKTFTCANCGDSYTEVIAALGHSWDNGTVIREATCTEKGVTAYTCTVCGEIEERDDIPTIPHTHGEGTVITEPTCTTMGKIAYECDVCGAAWTEDIIYNPHQYLDGACISCGGKFHAPSIYSCYSKTQTSVKVSWLEPESSEGYQLFRATSPDAPEEEWTCVKTLNGSSSSQYTNQGLEVGTTYYYKVRAFLTDVNGERMYSDFSPIAYMPAAVVFDGPYSNATFRIRLRWNEIGGAHGYQIWRLNEDGTYSIVKTLGDRGNELTDNQGATTAYSNTGLTAGETYTYKMRAFMITEDGRKVFGAYSDEYTVAVMPEAPVVTGTSPKATRAQLTWEALNGAAGYQIWMAEAEDGEYKIVKSITDGSTTYTKYDLTSGKTYYFKVRAYTEVEGKKTFGAYSEITAVSVV